MPGINMTYALNLGIARGYLRALPALLAQVLGVAAVALACIFGVAGILLAHPAALGAIKILGGAYIFIWASRPFWRAEISSCKNRSAAKISSSKAS
jgi:translocator protein, lysE family